MKKNSFFYALTVGALLCTTACNSDQNGEPAPESNDEQVITLAVANDNSVTRGGRELRGDKPGQKIDKVKIILTSTDGAVKWTEELDWATLSKTYENGREAKVVIPKTDKGGFTLVDGTSYKVYAYGYSSENSSYDLTPITGVTTSTTGFGDVKLSLTDEAKTNGMLGDEIFAGSHEVSWSATNHNIEMVLNRQVAGVYGYFEKIPYIETEGGAVGRYLHLVASNPQPSIYFSLLANTDHANKTGVSYVVNGFGGTAGETIIATIDLCDWFGAELKEEVVDGEPAGIIDDANWAKTVGETNAKKYDAGSVFFGKFLIPFARTAGNTFRLVLSTSETSVADPDAVHTWNILLPSNAKQTQEGNKAMVYNGTKFEKDETVDTRSIFNVLRNNLYSIGHRWSDKDDTGDPEDPNDPKPDPDDPDTPQPLNNEQDLLIRVNHNWEAIYRMDIE